MYLLACEVWIKLLVEQSMIKLIQSSVGLWLEMNMIYLASAKILHTGDFQVPVLQYYRVIGLYVIMEWLETKNLMRDYWVSS